MILKQAMIFRHHVALFLATGCYVGRFPVAPGTLGSLMGLPIAYALAHMHWSAAVLVCLGLVGTAVWVAEVAEHELACKDPGCIIIDEIAGMAITLLAIPMSSGTYVAGFILFRILDICKPPPIRQIECRLAGGWGIVMDDVAAAVMANIALRIGLYLIY
jgi:phosphatidylglycerophosphatase A